MKQSRLIAEGEAQVTRPVFIWAYPKHRRLLLLLELVPELVDLFKRLTKLGLKLFRAAFGFGPEPSVDCDLLLQPGEATVFVLAFVLDPL